MIFARSDFVNVLHRVFRLADSKTAQRPRGYRILPIIAGHLRGGLAQFKLRAHIL